MTIPRKELVRLMSLGRGIAFSFARRVPRRIDVADLVAAANLGLADALARGDKSDERSTSYERFERYATIRMVGAVIDELRLWDPLSREDRELAGRRSRAEIELSHRLGRAPELVEVAEVLGVSTEKLGELDQTYQAGHSPESLYMPSGEERRDFATDDHEEPGRQMDEGRVDRAFADLPERWRVVLELYYERDWTLKRIGETLGVTESRACQIRRNALERLRSDRRLKELRP